MTEDFMKNPLEDRGKGENLIGSMIKGRVNLKFGPIDITFDNTSGSVFDNMPADSFPAFMPSPPTTAPNAAPPPTTPPSMGTTVGQPSEDDGRSKLKQLTDEQDVLLLDLYELGRHISALRHSLGIDAPKRGTKDNT